MLHCLITMAIGRQTLNRFTVKCLHLRLFKSLSLQKLVANKAMKLPYYASMLDSSSVNGFVLCSGGGNIKAPSFEGASIKHVFEIDKKDSNT